MKIEIEIPDATMRRLAHVTALGMFAEGTVVQDAANDLAKEGCAVLGVEVLIAIGDPFEAMVQAEIEKLKAEREAKRKEWAGEENS